MKWNNVADQYLSIRDSRLTCVFPAVLELIRARNCRRLLDYGAGDGRFADLCLRNGIESVTAIDPTPRMQERAVATLAWAGSRARVSNALASLERNAYDAVAFNAVWMSLATSEECISCLREIHDALDASGVLVAAVTHPCFRDRQFSTFRTSFEMCRYGMEGDAFEVTLFDETGACELTDHHWSLGEMTRQLAEAGFLIERIVELADSDGPEWSRAFPWMLLVATRHPGSNVLAKAT